MGILDGILDFFDNLKKSDTAGKTGLVMSATNTAALAYLATTIKQYYSKTQERVREIEEFLKTVEDETNLTSEELRQLKILITDLMNEVNDKTLSNLINGVPEARKVKIIKHFLALKEHYHVILSTIMIELNRVLQEEGSEIKDKLETLKEGIDSNVKELQESQESLVDKIKALKDEVFRLSKLYSDLDRLKDYITSYSKQMESLDQNTGLLLVKVNNANKELSKSRASAILLLLLGALLGLEGNIVANTVIVKFPQLANSIGLFFFVFSLTGGLFYWFYRRLRLEL